MHGKVEGGLVLEFRLIGDDVLNQSDSLVVQGQGWADSAHGWTISLLVGRFDRALLDDISRPVEVGSGEGPHCSGPDRTAQGLQKRVARLWCDSYAAGRVEV